MYDLYIHNRNWGARIHEFVFKGHRMISLENRYLRIVVAVDKGTDIIEFLYKPLDIDFMWHSYTGLRPHAGTIPTNPNPAGPFLDYYPGGWQELLPSAGMDCSYRGAALGIHGEVCLLPWDYRIERDEPDEVSASFSVRTIRTPFFLQKKLTLAADSGALLIEETVCNESGEAFDFIWGHHPAFGWPFLDDSCRIVLPECTVITPPDYVAPSSRLEKGQETPWPTVKARAGGTIDLSRIPGPEAASHDMAYMTAFHDGWYAILNERQKVGFGLSWDKQTFPFLWFWQVYRGGVGYPWFHSTYVIALEPVSSYKSPLTAAVEAGTQLTLGPGEKRTTRLAAVAFAGGAGISGIDLETGRIL